MLARNWSSARKHQSIFYNVHGGIFFLDWDLLPVYVCATSEGSGETGYGLFGGKMHLVH